MTDVDIGHSGSQLPSLTELSGFENFMTMTLVDRYDIEKTSSPMGLLILAPASSARRNPVLLGGSL